MSTQWITKLRSMSDLIGSAPWLRTVATTAVLAAGSAAVQAGAFPAWTPDTAGDRVGAYVQPAGTVEEFVKPKRAMAVRIEPTVVDLGEWSGEKDLPLQPDGVLQVGAKRSSVATTNAAQMNTQLHWQPSANGGQVAALSFVSKGAYGLRLGVQIDQLPGSALMRVFSQDQRDNAFEIAGQRIQQSLETNRLAGDTTAAGRTWWTPGSDGDELTLEIEIPPGTPTSAVQISIPSILHVYQNLSLPIAGEDDAPTKIGEAMYCQQDATCFEQFAQQRNAVARMIFVTPQGGFLCTGTLVNDKASSGTPHFLTANHCINTQTVASTLQTFWFYRSPSCNAKTLSSASKTLQNGATLLYSTTSPDITLLRLNDSPPAGAVFSGWDAGSQTRSATAIGIHHPRGDLLKLSTGVIDGGTNCVMDSAGGVTCTSDSATSMNGTYYRVKWSQGTTEGGSSGSGLFVGGLLTGVLSSGTGECLANRAYTNYARLDVSYPALQKWLAATPVVDPNPTPGSGRSAVYRFYNTKSGAHFYTISSSERDYVIATYREFQYENVAFYAYDKTTTGMNAVFRFYNSKTGAHFYTISAPERDYVISDFADFRYEGPVWYAQPAAGNGATPIYRFYNNRTGAHFYTVSASERDFVISNYKDFKYESIAYYVWTTP